MKKLIAIEVYNNNGAWQAFSVFESQDNQRHYTSIKKGNEWDVIREAKREAQASNVPFFLKN